ncbi:hypothetical protein PPYR_10954 [Photinus pyralis]|uniref:UPAR/Ly6 domain-containing protein n=1 Tax=Photinus pyralis TaxID=7054 RepID=A0A1Y1JYB9_PHOPY|nr:uncharacterized protein LOC116174210 isoform X2 [Photinus pyralis]KAB0796893.1 hypothetical protein PPYR_10954 [Photinus pyralis]
MFLVVLLISNALGVSALNCYTCKTTENENDKRCITNPGAVEGNAITNCNKNYCTTVRVEYTDPKDRVQSMSRDCVDKPIYSNQVIEDATYRVYYTSCRADLCNGGTGKDISIGGGMIHSDGVAVVLYVLGLEQSSGLSAGISNVMLFLGINTLLLTRYILL